MKSFDPALANPFKVDWLVPMDRTSADDLTRAVAEKAEALLRGARFLEAERSASCSDGEVRIWVQAAHADACVSITWEPCANAFAFHLMDESLRERLACVVFEGMACVRADESILQADAILDAALDALGQARIRSTIPDLADRVRAAGVRVPVRDAPREPPGGR